MGTSVERVKVFLEMVNSQFNARTAQTQEVLGGLQNRFQQFGSVLALNFQQWQNANKAAVMSRKEFSRWGKKLPSNELAEFGMALDQNRFFTDAATGAWMQAEGAQKRMTDTISGGARKAGNSFRQFTHGIRGFRMELLGAMFFMMMMQQTIRQLLAPAAEAAGVFDVWKAILQILFLPIMLIVLWVLLWLLDIVADMPDWLKFLIGAFVLLVLVLVIIGFLVFAFALGLGALVMLLPQIIAGFTLMKIGLRLFGQAIKQVLGKAWSLFKLVFRWVFRFVTSGLAALIVLVIGLWLAFKENFGNIRDWALLIWVGMKDMAGGFFDFLKGGWEFIVGIFTLNGDKIKSGAMRMWNGLVRFIGGALKAIYGLIITLGLGALRGFKFLWDSLVKLTLWLVSKMSDGMRSFFSKIYNWGKDLVGDLGRGIRNSWWKFKDALVSVFRRSKSAIKNWLSNFWDNILPWRRGGGDSNDSGGNNPKQNDFISRPGGGITPFSSQDTIVGFKGDSPFGGGTNITQNININVSDKEMMRRMIDDNNRKLVDDIRRLTRA